MASLYKPGGFLRAPRLLTTCCILLNLLSKKRLINDDDDDCASFKLPTLNAISIPSEVLCSEYGRRVAFNSQLLPCWVL